MRTAARFGLLAGWSLALSGALVIAAEAPARSTPTRPGGAGPVGASGESPAAAAPAIRKIGRVEHVAVADAARALGLKLVAQDSGRRVALTGGGVRADLETDTRDITINGTRVFLGDPVVAVGGQLHVSRVDFERCLTPMLRPGHGLAARPATRVVLIDPGHGGTDPGKINTKLGINEKTFTLDVARRVRALLEKAGHRVVLTREDDSFVALPQRAAMASVVRADMFVSIHFNALANDTKTSGVEVYTFAPRTQRSTNAWGLLEKDDTEDYASPGNRFDHWNVVLAHALHRRFIGDLRTPDRGKKLMHLAVLRPLSCPGMLIECGFLTSETEARKIATPAYRHQIAGAIAAGIRDYAATLDGLRLPVLPTPARTAGGK
ncbi:MAG: N-acetylmuramoyl-L-alanine amidase [Verrucomicrobia bacterium]|nr:N-acetylmuramoyl-L-alanine amidase [Verrucomicrobiota bacterium]